ncbi:MAG: VWA domain-containing protein [Clostridiales bacterium]|nr:VWA domain-containing protein [Clostridiales bacterium]
MKKGLTEIVFILDRSGSMGGLENDTIGGYNSMIEKQKTEEGEVIISTVLFDHETEVLHDRVPLDKIRPITEKEYFVRGSTALLDAVGGAIHHIGNVHKYARPEDVPEKTLFIITTDGMENSSTRYNYDRVKKMVGRQKEKYHWEFIFLGANIDAVEVAGRFGVDKSRAVTYECDSAGTKLNYQVMGRMVSCARVAKSAMAMEEAFDRDEMLSDIRKDYEKRHK